MGIELNNLFSKENRHEFLEEISGTLINLQPELTAVDLGDNGLQVHGKFACSNSEGVFERFHIECDIPFGFPLIRPNVREKTERLGTSSERHVFTDGSCCFCVWEEWLIEQVRNNRPVTFEEFLRWPLHNYFVAQVYFEGTGQWPEGWERSHNEVGILEAVDIVMEKYAKDFGFKKIPALKLLQKDTISDVALCPCGSSKQINQCHKQSLLQIRAEVPPEIWRLLYYRYKKSSFELKCRTRRNHRTKKSN